jgi:RES domain-containing protein
MRVWRICRQPYVETALDGIGGLYTSGRWHSQGVPIVYTASSAALAALEVLVHVDPLTAPADLRLLSIDLPSDLCIDALETSSLPIAWLRSAGTAALSVPSAVIRTERNILLNPRHPEAKRILLISDEPFSFDPRLL